MSDASTGQIVGAIIGGAVGGVQGAYYGYQIGGMIDPPDLPGIDGPKLSDPSEQTSGFGVGLHYPNGTTKVPGHVFWIENNSRRVVAVKTETGGKGGGGSQETTTYEYYGTFAVMLCDKPIKAIGRLWDSRGLLLNTGATDIDTAMATSDIFPLAHLYNPNTVDQLKAALQVTPTPGPNGEIRLYPGFDDQMPDPRMEADLGVGNCSAYRGCSYLVFYDWPLPQEYGQSIAGVQVSAEVIVDGDDGTAVLLNEIQIDLPSGYQNPSCNYLTPSLSRVYMQNGPTLPADPPTAFRAFDIGPHGVQPANPEYTAFAAGTHVPARGLTDTDIGPIGLSDATDLISSFPGRPSIANARFYRKGSNGSGVWFAITSTGTLYVGFEETDTNDTLALGASPMEIAMDADDNAIVLFNNSIKIYDQTLTLQRTIDTTSTIGGGMTFDAVWMDYDEGVLYVGIAGGNHVKNIYPFDMDNETIGDVIALRDLDTDTYPGSVLNEEYSNFRVKGSILTRYNKFTSGGPSSALLEHYRLPTPGTTGETLAAVVRERLEQSELIESGDIDVTDLTGTVRGFNTQGVGSIRSQVEPLMLGYQFDLIQDGYQLKAIMRGNASVITVDPDDLDARPYGNAPGDALTSSREMDTQLPAVVIVRHKDAARDYEVNEQHYQADPSSASVNKQEFDLPLVFTPDEAAGKAEIIGVRRWLERTPKTFRLPPTYLNVQPSDVLTLPMDYGTFEVFIQRVNYTVDGRVECESVLNDSALYTPNAVGSSGNNTSATTVSYGGSSVLHLLDIPLIQDAYDTPGYPVAMCGYSPTWPGGVVVKSSDDGQTWQPLQGFSGDVVSGVVPTALAADEGYRIDRTNTLTVTLNNSGMSISSITETQMLSGQNWAAYGVDDRWEIIQFANVTDNGDGTLTLDTLVRGAKGTEWATGLHAAYDFFVFISDADMEFLNAYVGEIGVQRYFRGLTHGQDLDDVSDQLFTYGAENLTPLSVHAPTGTFSGGALTIDAHPRTRVSSSWWETGTSGPIGETSESYEIDIMDGATVKRTLTGTSFPIVYSSADHVADFGSLQAAITCNIYQMSSVVGRGRVKTATFNDESSVLSETHPDLIALWDVANVSGSPISTLPDSSVNGNDGTITGCTFAASELVFAGSGDRVTLPSGVELALPITLSLWVEMTSIASNTLLFQSSDWADQGGNYTGFVIEVLSTGAVQVQYGDGGTPSSTNRRTKTTASSTVATSTPYHMLIEIVSSTNMTIMLDDSDQGGSYSGTGGALANSGTYDGKIGGITTGFLNAKLSKKNRLFKKALTTAEKTTLFNET